MPRLEDERCPEGGPGLQVTGADSASRRCPFPALPRGDLLRPPAGCALGLTGLPRGHGGAGKGADPQPRARP